MDSEEPQVESNSPSDEFPKHKLQQQTRAHLLPASDGSWRPGRSSANREINLGLHRSQQLQKESPACSKGGNEGTTLTGNKRKQDQQQDSFRGTSETANTQTTTEPSSKRPRRPIPSDWKPPLAVGASLGDSLSRLEEAERSVVQWEAILDNSRKTEPFADLSSIEKQLEKVRRQFNEMEECDENTIPIDELESTKRMRVDERLGVLNEALMQSKCPTGDVNIRVAIEAYREGSIQCWDKWTLLYAGQIVDHCSSYDSFTQDRQERLNRYSEEHGQGWLWFEPPLAPSADSQPDQLMAATWAQPSKDGGKLSGGLHHALDITMGFRRVKGFHSRLSSLLSAEVKTPSISDTGKVLLYKTRQRHPYQKLPKEMCFVEDDVSAPRCFFMMQLDSGASHPCLYNTDLDLLGINRDAYPAQTTVTVNTANGHVRAAVYEMRVDVCRHNGQSLVGDEPVWPNDRHELGGIVPVMVLVESSTDESKPLSEGELEMRQRRGDDVSEEGLANRKKSSKEVRLSGMLPFQVCYSAGAPGMKLWFGEDRRDVLGADRMPGQRRWERHKIAKFVRRPREADALEERPRVIFDHRFDGKRVYDADARDHTGASSLSIVDEEEVRRFWLEPREVKKLQPLKHQVKRVLPESPDEPLESKRIKRSRQV
ncbi:hypothetical protein FZEAL_2946 [Fusarium zealandicum]|uniref:Uncharacterized protein n=1 Tax=Fusarium zealandicum TaxID=1053134 RepID=A0A8H4UQF8_9HYPO|nr:hypothetical protein FZEAL_2946 [Fusarium zealandicum]